MPWSSIHHIFCKQCVPNDIPGVLIRWQLGQADSFKGFGWIILNIKGEKRVIWANIRENIHEGAK